MYIYIYIGLSWLLELWQQLRTRGVGGGVGWDVNVHVNLQQDVNVHVNGTSFTNRIQVCAVPRSGDEDDDDDDDGDDDENDPNETCKFRDEISSRNGQVFPT